MLRLFFSLFFLFLSFVGGSSCAFHDDDKDVRIWEAGDCPDGLSSIEVVPATEGFVRLDAKCPTVQSATLGTCPEMWHQRRGGFSILGVCFSDNFVAIATIAMPQGGKIISKGELFFYQYSYEDWPFEDAFDSKAQIKGPMKEFEALSPATVRLFTKRR